MDPAPLTPEETDELRRAVLASQRNRAVKGRRVPIMFTGGALDGMKVALPEWSSKCQYIGWCHLRHDGPIQVLYRRAGPGVWAFDRLEDGPR